MEWVLSVAPENAIMDIYKWLSSTYLHYATWNFKDINDNSNMHKHYNSYKIKFSLNEERENFKRIANSFSEEKINDVDLMNEYRNYINKIILKNKINLLRFYSAKYLRQLSLLYKIFLILRSKIKNINSL